MRGRLAVAVICLSFLSVVSAHGQARITASTMDSNGNVFVTGWRTVIKGAQWDIATSKYDKNGIKQWTHSYPNSAVFTDAESWGIAVDPAGNVYVAAHAGVSTNVDCVLIKYPRDYQQGQDPAWVRTWDGGVWHDQWWTIAVDSDGFIYVTGYSTQVHDSVQESDVVTAKYDGDGNMVWGPYLYNGPGNSGEDGLAIAVDPVTKNVAVTGVSRGGPAPGGDIVTFLHDAQGAVKWVRRYSGPIANGLNKGTSVAFDAAGSLYVTGWSQGTNTPSDGVTDIDWATIKYDGAGNEVWVSRYDGPGGSNDQPAPPVHGGGGKSSFGNYIQTNQGIVVTSEVMDPLRELPYLAGKVTALGLNKGLTNSLQVKLNACIAALQADNAASRNNAHNVLGAFVNQVRSLAAEGLIGAAAATEVTSVANQIIKGILGIATTVVYVSGQSTGASGGTNVDFATVKYNGEDGSPMWNLPGQPGTTPEKPGIPADVALRYNGAANGVDRIWGMALDFDGNIYVTGPSMEDSARSVDYFTRKYFVNTYQPAVLAEARYDGPGQAGDQSCGFATWRDPVSGRSFIFRDPLTGADYVAVTGNSIGPKPPGSQDYVTVVYDGGLALRWIGRYYW
jgi:hypothetical protein